MTRKHFLPVTICCIGESDKDGIIEVTTPLEERIGLLETCDVLTYDTYINKFSTVLSALQDGIPNMEGKQYIKYQTLAWL